MSKKKDSKVFPIRVTGRCPNCHRPGNVLTHRCGK
jgi:hypothetical protein